MPDTSATIAADVMMEMWTTKQPPTGTYPKKPTLLMADLVANWVTDQPQVTAVAIDNPAVSEADGGYGVSVVDPKATGVTLAYFSLICKRGYKTPDDINAAVNNDPYLTPSSLSSGAIDSDDFYQAYRDEIAPQLAPTNSKPTDDPWDAWNVNWPVVLSKSEQSVQMVLKAEGIPIDTESAKYQAEVMAMNVIWAIPPE